MELIRLDLTEKVAWLTLDRPPLNVLNIAMLRELHGALEQIAHNEAVSVVVLSGAGEKAFSAGVDVADHTLDKVDGMIKAFHHVLRKLARLPQTTVAAVDGVALGGGLELASMCDLVLASEKSKVGFPEIHLACFPPMAMAALSKITGRPAASDLVLTGEVVPAQRAMALGLVSRVFENADFDDKLRGVVAGLAEKSPAVLRMTTQALRGELLNGFYDALDRMEDLYLDTLVKQPDMIEGIEAFIGKRKPVWKS